MAQIPVTTRPGPDQELLHDVMRRVAAVESPDAPILSVYLDVRPEAHGEVPGERRELVILRDRLREIAATYTHHTDARRSVDADIDRIEAHMQDPELTSAAGVAIFACQAASVWESVTAGVPFTTEVRAGPTADLFQLAALLDEAESDVVALVDTNTCRLFVTRIAGLEERSGPDEPPDEHERQKQGGWSQARYQRHVDMQDRRFAREAAEAIDRLAAAVNARHIILAGDERAMAALEPELPDRVRSRVARVEHLQMHSRVDDVEAEVMPLLAALREGEDQEAADRVVAGVRSGELGVAGIDRVAEALEAGQAHELVIDEEAAVDPELRAELVRQAANTGAEVVIVHGHKDLAAMGGVGATLRYRAWPL